jgi:hypothetical protein
VRGRADVPDLGAQVAGVQRDLVGKRDERRVEIQVAPVGAVPERQLPRRAERDGLGPGPLLRDNRRAREQAV